MITLFAMMAQNSSGGWTHILLVIFFVVLIWLVVKIVIIRWIFRINEQIELLSQIRDELKIINEKKV